MAFNIERLYKQAKKEGRLCIRCGWMVTVNRWRKGLRTCGACNDALKGVNVKYGNRPYDDDPQDKTGETI